VAIRQSLQPHPCIVTLHRAFETSSFLLLLLDFELGENLLHFLHRFRDDRDAVFCVKTAVLPPLAPPSSSSLRPSRLPSRSRLLLIISMFSDMCNAVAACHDRQVFRCGITLGSFAATDLFSVLPDGRRDRQVVVKITNFGSSSGLIQSSDTNRGSVPYMSYGTVTLILLSLFFS
jgi:serine/threonine protein kinase